MRITTLMTRLFAVGDTTEVLRECNEILKVQEPLNPGTYLIRGLAHSLQENENADQNAVSDFSRFIELTEGNPLGFQYRARAYEKIGQFDDALNDLNQAIDYYSKENQQENDLLVELIERRTVVEFKQASAHSDTTDTETLKPEDMLAEAFEDLAEGNIEQAIATSENLCQQNNRNINAVFLRAIGKDLRGRQFAKNNDTVNAETDFQNAIDDYSEVIDDTTSEFINMAYARRPLLCISIKRYQDAIGDLSEAIKRDPNDLQMYLHRGIAAMRCYRYNEALLDFDHVLGNDSKNVQALELKGEVALKLFAYDTALRCFQTAQEHCHEKITTIRIMLLQALAFYLLKNYTEALQLMQEIKRQIDPLEDNESRDLKNKFELLQENLPFFPEFPSEAEEIARAQETFDSQAPEKERCDAGLLFLLGIIFSVRSRTRGT